MLGSGHPALISAKAKHSTRQHYTYRLRRADPRARAALIRVLGPDLALMLPAASLVPRQALHCLIELLYTGKSARFVASLVGTLAWLGLGMGHGIFHTMHGCRLNSCNRYSVH